MFYKSINLTSNQKLQFLDLGFVQLQEHLHLVDYQPFLLIQLGQLISLGFGLELLLLVVLRNVRIQRVVPTHDPIIQFRLPNCFRPFRVYLVLRQNVILLILWLLVHQLLGV